MTDRLCAEHAWGDHEDFPVSECPKCEQDITELLDETDEPEDA